MGALLPEVHGPIRIIATGENCWGGQITLTGVSPKDVTGLNTKIFRTTSRVIFSAANTLAAQAITGQVTGRTTNYTTGIQMNVPTHGTLRLVFNAAIASGGKFNFILFNAGTNV